MKNILEKIVKRKIEEVAEAKQKVSEAELQRSSMFQRTPFSLKASLTDKNKTGIIAEFKRRSPSKGIINANAKVEDVTKAYTENGASCLSVLTDKDFFGGSLEDLKMARQNNIPILRKDFMIDEYQILEACANGADVILLIAACLNPQRVKELATYAKQLDLEVLLEIHGDDELACVCDEVDFVGVNNRNLKTFEVDIENSIRLLNKLPKDKLAIAESGIDNVEVVKQLRSAGFKGFLIGENFMKHENPGEAFKNYVQQLKVIES
ncbi:indole-3-glycerol phosphate synthase [Arachidicoccus ginsenosidimutans]|uniref:indole-3-glycerol phosphate synthase TrpC n=1 Tax=Arachidicoccus sp. BS20 TaxID=1850526 RepID=UPI0007F0DC98|nr:indole-3-glycerol phosphate synthase TrpC [Arachidicoccus sp. BS20]ANI88179.1 indole-3-glycerol phosphate synthase [Arachidicoccus sp. BS20]